ncbi:MAG: efflux transporter periplasmic adaptor subunit, partial [Desulfobacterales bacterium]
MKKRIIFTIVGLVVLIGVLGGIKGLQISRMITHGKQFVPLPETVTTFEVHPKLWQSLITSVGSLEAVQGVMVTAELKGKVENITFEPGTAVRAGHLLVQQDISSEAAQLRASEAAVALAK